MKKEFLTIILATLIMTTAQVLFKTGANKLPEISLSLLFAVILYFTAAGLVLIALKTREISYVYPLLATSFIWVGIVSVLFLGEFLSLLNWLGILLIFLGVSLIK